MKVKPVGHALLIKIKPIEEEVSCGGIIKATTIDLHRKELRQDKGTVLSIGQDAYSDKEAPWCKVGDRIYFVEYGGRALKVGEEDTPTHRLIQDIDVLAVEED